LIKSGLRFIAIAGLLLILGGVTLQFVYLSKARSFEEVRIPAEGYEIAGYLSPGTSPGGPWVVFGHGNRREGQASELYRRLTNNLSREASVLAIDFRGFGQSSSNGLASADKILDRSGDFDAAVAYLKENFGATNEDIILMGHSLGAAQALKAAHDEHYRLAVPIGLGNYEVVVGSQQGIRSYGEKFRSNTGVTVAPEVVLRESEQFTPLSLFSPCPETPVALVFGAYEHAEALLHQPAKIPEDCAASIQWIVIPFADHMYGTEKDGLPKPLQRLYVTFSLSLLTWQINQLLRQ